MTSESDKGKGEIVLYVDTRGIARRREYSLERGGERGLVTRVSEAMTGRAEIPDFSDEDFRREYSPRFFEGIKNLEREMFAQRQTGRFLVFPPQVLGMDSTPYKIPKGWHNWSSISIGFYPHCDIQIPDNERMNELRKEESKQYEKVMDFYRALNGQGTIVIYRNHNVLSNLLLNLPLYHNGARVGKDERIEGFKHKDVFRIGNSILFAYIEVEKSGDLQQLEKHRSAQEQGLVVAPSPGIIRR